MAIVSAEWEELLQNLKPMNLAADMVIDILSKLPVKSIIRFKSTCKPWHNFLNAPKFCQMHLDRAITSGNDCLLLRHLSERMTAGESIFSSDLWTRGFHVHYRKEVYSFRSKQNFEELGKVEDPFSTYNFMIGSMNGIVCLINKDNVFLNSFGGICLWNPAIRELKVLPGLFVKRRTACETIGVGFAYVQSSNDYKVVVILKVRGTNICKVMVYSLRAECWNESSMVITSRFHDLASKVYVNGKLHWLNFETFSPEQFILCFEMNEEKFSTIELPDISTRVYRVNILQAPLSLGESLVALTCSFNEGCVLWFMREYGIKQSWTKMYSIPHWIGYNIEPVGWFNPEVLISVISDNSVLVSYNLLDHTVKTLHTRVTTPACFGTYVQSLVSLGGAKPRLNHHPAYYNTGTVNQGKRKSR